MRFLADMGLARSTVLFLSDHGHDAIHWREQGLQRLKDERIVEKARQEGRAVLTHDLDSGRIVALSTARQPSIVTFRLSDMRPTQVNHYLAQVVSRFSAELEAGAQVSVNEQSIRVRSLPIGARS